MKKIYLFICLFLIVNNVYTNAQEKELICGEHVYIHDESRNTIKNKKNIIPVKNTCYQTTVDGKFSFDIISNIFSQKELFKFVHDKKNISVTCMCNSKGIVKEVMFRLGKTPLYDIKLSQIRALEEYIIGQKIEIISRCPETKYYMVGQPIRFREYLDEK